METWGKSYDSVLLTDEPYKNVRCTKEIFEKARAEYPEMLAVAFVMNEDEIAAAVANKYGMRRMSAYRNAGKLYGHSNSITGPLILGGILKNAGHEVEVYEELNGGINLKRLMETTDVFCISIMTSTAERGYVLADTIHRECGARVLMGGYHATALPEEVAEHVRRKQYQGGA